MLFIEPGSPWENGYVESFNAAQTEPQYGIVAASPLTTQMDGVSPTEAMAEKLLQQNWCEELKRLVPVD